MAQKKVPVDPVEAAVKFVKDRGSGVPAREVLDAVADQIKIKTLPERSQFMAELHTQLCLDNRLVNVMGNWTMKDWAPKPKTRGASLRATTLSVARKRKAEVPVEEEEEEEPPPDEEVETTDDADDGDDSSWD